MVKNGARRGSSSAEWGKEGWKWCRMVQGGAVIVQNGARKGGDGEKWCKEGSNGAKWGKEGL